MFMIESGRCSRTRNPTERSTVRRLLLFTVLSIVATLVFAPTVLAQQSGPASNFLEVPEGTPPCPLGLDEVKEIYGPNVTCGEGGGYVLDTSDSSTPPATSSGTADVQTQVTQVGEGNIACVQTAVQENIVSQGKGNAQANQSGDNEVASANVNVQQIAQECNISVNEADTAVKYVSVKKFAPVKKYASATASATAAPVVQYEYKKSAAPAVQYEYSASPSASAYSATASASSAPAAELPPTGGSSLIALGAGVLLVAGGLLARRIVR
jgi:hypothetical protein